MAGANFVDSAALACRFGSIGSIGSIQCLGKESCQDGGAATTTHDTFHVVAARFVSPSRVECVSPALRPGTLHVLVTNNGDDFVGAATKAQTAGGATVAAAAVTFTSYAAPFVTLK